ncbi:hypothetical protein BDR03DRAFT_872049, partial [Suillus americanus]
LQANPAMYLDELQEQLLTAWNKDISLATLSRATQRLGMTHKDIATGRIGVVSAKGRIGVVSATGGSGVVSVTTLTTIGSAGGSMTGAAGSWM